MRSLFIRSNLRTFQVAAVLSAFTLIFPLVRFSAQGPSTNLSFRSYLEGRLQKAAGNKKANINDLCPIDLDPIALRVLTEYGSMFVGEATRSPETCTFADPKAVESFHRQLEVVAVDVNGVKIELQKAAASALEKAIFEAADSGRRITALDGAIAGRRNFEDTLRIWNSRFLPALDHWVAKGKITRPDAEASIRMPLREQIKRVVEWEASGYYFSTGRSKSIFYSVAPPGTSQHLSLIAFDVVEASDPKIRAIMNKYGWFQTIKTDRPHFTYLGVPESELPLRGLKQINRDGHKYWVPDI